MMAFVRGVTATSARRGSMFRVSGRISAKTGRAPQWMMALAEAMKLCGLTMTSSPGFKPKATKQHINALVPELVARIYGAPRYWANSFSSVYTLCLKRGSSKLP